MKFGQKIKRARLNNGIKIEQIAHFTGISVNDLRRIENLVREPRKHEVNLISYFFKSKKIDVNKGKYEA